MCLPAAAAIPLAIASTAVTAAGAIYSGVGQSRQLAYKSKVEAQNARMDAAAANDARARGAKEENRQYQRTAQLLGAQRAAQAANGIETQFGSASAIQADTLAIGAEDAATIRENTRREALGYEISSANMLSQSAASRSAGKAAAVATAFDVGKTILSGASQVAGYKAGAGGGSGRLADSWARSAFGYTG